MRDLFEEIFAKQPLDPTEAARRAVRPQFRRRFYQNVDTDATDGAFRVLLDGRPIKTPARHLLAAPTQALAQALADEWREQRDVIDPQKMPLTRLANTIIDGVSAAPPAVAADIEKYLASDLVLYRAESPAGLVARQAAAWDPVLAWAERDLGARFVPTSAMAFVAQSARALAAGRAAIAQDASRDIWRLGALHAITTLTGSALIALALMRAALSAEAAWAAAHIDEDWNMERWGHDALALERRASRFAELRAAATVLQLTPTGAP
jgi:chaperone required for assembly of F1-ATPase